VKNRTLVLIAGALLPTTVASDTQSVNPDDFLTIKIGDVIMICAVFLAPIFALWGPVAITTPARETTATDENLHDPATRQTALDAEHVKVLNMIDVEFAGNGPRDREIRAVWGSYLAQLNIPVPPPGPANQHWETQRVDLLSMLL
jgi:hypothetical protein